MKATCEICHKNLKKYQKKYCSRKCFYKSMKETRKGKNNPGFKRGKYCRNAKKCVDCGKKIGYTSKKCRNCAERIKHLGKNNPMYGRTGKNHPMFGVHRFGKQSPNWQGGLSNEPYPIEWTKILKESIRIRDNRQCQICGKLENVRKLDVHHIDYDKNNLNPENLISLCLNCHRETNGNKNIYIEYFRILKEIIIC